MRHQPHIVGIVALLTAFLALPHAAQAAGDAAKGEVAYKRHCAICHDTAAGKQKVGPSLHAIVGRKAGTVDGYKLYRGLRDATWTWDDAALNAYLTDPAAYVKSNNAGKSSSMVFKLGNQQDRDDVIAYLKTLK